ncbi:hypothetical protein PHYSODRAFT_440849, partial [Phytophthora sojae]
MNEEEAVLVATYSAVAQVAVLLSGESDDAPRGPKEQIRTVTSLHFEPMLQSAAYASWFEDNLRCTKPTFL